MASGMSLEIGESKDELSSLARPDGANALCHPRNDWRERLSYGDPGKGLPLPEHLRRSGERLLQYDLSAVRIHFSAFAERFGALAFTHGTDIYLAPVWATLSPGSQLFLLGHELRHVVQQWEQRLPASGARTVRVLSDPQLEKEADAAGRRLAAAIQTGVEPSSRKRPFPLCRDTNWDFAQCYVAIKLMGMSAPRELTEANSAYDEIYEGTQKGGDASLGNPMILKKTQILQVLKQWIGTYNNRAARFVLSQPAVNRTYESWSELARALIGEVDSAPNLLKEDDLAKKTVQSGYINDHLASLILKVAAKVQMEADSTAKKSVQSKWHKGKYYPWYYFRSGGFAGVMASPKTYPFAAKVAVLHDLSDFFNDTNPVGATDVPLDKQSATAIVGQDPFTAKYAYNKVPLGATTTFRRADGTLLEDSPIIRAARENKMPLSYGPSYTTGRLMQLTQFSGGSADEFQAMAWGIFAFWNQFYYTSQSGIHRFHCVMDMANNYGVPYTPFQYPSDPPDYQFQVVVI